MGYRYRNTKTKGEVEFTRPHPDLEASDDWKLIQKGDGLPANAPNPGILDAPAVLSEGKEATHVAQGYAAGAALDLGIVGNSGVDSKHPRKADA